MRTRDVWLPTIIGGLVLSAPALAIDDDARSPEAVEAARALLREVGQAYAKAPAMTDEMTVVYTVPEMGDQTFTCAMRFEGDDAEVTGLAELLDIYIVDGTFYATTTMSETRAVKAKLGDEPAETMTTALGGDLAQIAPPHLLFRYGASPEQIERAMGLGLVSEPAIAGHQMAKTDDGATVHEVLIAGSGDGMTRVHVDPDTKLIVGWVTEGLPEGYPGTEPIVARSTYQPKVMDKLAAPITFDVGDRELHETFDDMMTAAMADGGGMGDINPSIEVGTEAPTFALLDQDGERHTLEGYRGQVVVLDWWGIW